MKCSNYHYCVENVLQHVVSIDQRKIPYFHSNNWKSRDLGTGINTVIQCGTSTVKDHGFKSVSESNVFFLGQENLPQLNRLAIALWLMHIVFFFFF